MSHSLVPTQRGVGPRHSVRLSTLAASLLPATLKHVPVSWKRLSPHASGCTSVRTMPRGHISSAPPMPSAHAVSTLTAPALKKARSLAGISSSG